MLFELSDRHGFVIALRRVLQRDLFPRRARVDRHWAAWKPRRNSAGMDFKNLISLTSLSKRSNVPGMRSGFVAGDAAIIKQFLLYRTYHGSAMSPVVQAASTAAWRDEQHVVENRALYRSKFAQVTPLAGRGAGRGAARRRLLFVGQSEGQ